MNMNDGGGGGDGGAGSAAGIGDTHRKDNTGYDLKHLFIGAEGTLVVVTGRSPLRVRRFQRLGTSACEETAAKLSFRSRRQLLLYEEL